MTVSAEGIVLAASVVAVEEQGEAVVLSVLSSAEALLELHILGEVEGDLKSNSKEIASNYSKDQPSR